MSWSWNTNRVGKLKGNLSNSTKLTTLNGISGNAITTTPDNTVNTVNIILDIGGKAMTVNENLVYDRSEGAINNDD